MVTEYERKQEELEHTLSKMNLIRRLIEGGALILFSAIAILFYALREASKEVKIIGSGFFTYESVIYNEDYLIGIIIGVIGLSFAVAFLISDLLLCRYSTAHVGSNDITVYRGMTKCVVYINGEEKAKLGLFSLSSVVEIKLDDGIKLIVSFVRGIFTIAHLSFSDNTPSIEL